jgi:Fe-S-cluster containining protein
MVHSRIENRSYPLKEEMIKVKGKPDTGECVFLTREGCSIYEHRPIQCKRFECWNPRNLINTFKANKLTRKDIVHHSEIMADIIPYHDRKCSYTSLKQAFRELENTGQDSKVLDILSYDTALRTYLQEKLTLSFDEMDFFGQTFYENSENVLPY